MRQAVWVGWDIIVSSCTIVYHWFGHLICPCESRFGDWPSSDTTVGRPWQMKQVIWCLYGGEWGLAHCWDSAHKTSNHSRKLRRLQKKHSCSSWLAHLGMKYDANPLSSQLRASGGGAASHLCVGYFDNEIDKKKCGLAHKEPHGQRNRVYQATIAADYVRHACVSCRCRVHGSTFGFREMISVTVLICTPKES